MNSDPEAADNSTPYNDAERVDQLIKYLEEQPPYEAVGKVVVAAAELELNLIALALEAGINPKKAWYRDKRGKFLRSSETLGDDVLDRIEAVADSRDLISHGIWINLFDRGHAFLRPDREALGENLKGRLVTTDDLAAWHRDLVSLGEIVADKRRARESTP